MSEFEANLVYRASSRTDRETLSQSKHVEAKHVVHTFNLRTQKEEADWKETDRARTLKVWELNPKPAEGNKWVCWV